VLPHAAAALADGWRRGRNLRQSPGQSSIGGPIPKESGRALRKQHIPAHDRSAPSESNTRFRVPSICYYDLMWLLYAFSGPIFWAISTHIDKYLVDRYFGTATPQC
jgi:hypothetical protein